MLLYTFGLTIFYIAIWNGVSRSVVSELRCSGKHDNSYLYVGLETNGCLKIL